jgi:hypothetical protein
MPGWGKGAKTRNEEGKMRKDVAGSRREIPVGGNA